MNSKKKKREPNCALCLNHGIKALLRGHKRHCVYRDCKCIKCNETRKRQEYMADMQYIKRNGIAEEARLGKRADMIAIFNERMKNKMSKKKSTESSDMVYNELGSSDSVSCDLDDNLKSISLEDADLDFQNIVNYVHNELKIKEIDEVIYISLLVLVQEFDSVQFAQIMENILNVYKEL